MTFRFAFIFFILFILCLDWSVNPVLSYLFYEGYLAELLDGAVQWTGKNLFHIPYTIISPYDGQHNDRTYIYLLYFIMAAAAVLGTVVWSMLDRRKANYDILYYWLTTVLRYYLAFTLFLFALEKFFKVQFPDLDLYTLTQTVGDMSPMSLAWTFFGYSYGYNIFMGIAESAALLLLFRRTMTFGAILTIFTLANVMAVNYNYDVHAKMYPTALLVMTLFLLLPSIHSLFKFFFTGQPTSLPVIQAPVSKKRWVNYSKTALKILVIGCTLVFILNDYADYKNQLIASELSKAQSGLSGVYDISSFVRNQDTLSSGDPMRWQEIIIGGARERIRLQGDSIAFLNVSEDNHEILVHGDRLSLGIKEQEIYNELGLTISTYDNMDSIMVAQQAKSRLQFELTDSVTLKLKGKIKNDSVFVIAIKRPVTFKDFRLMKRDFHWINEVVYMY
ncbi:hypothetical protein D0X99_15350 [Algoriphagus lacus]|uniref:DoxX family protein n=2 Tax=Algoriphagus lacus TaxID=2056311 RepID=A0A418PNS5_9BACT|nr:hypothetical protein D0X99_15350 [Algoriphagus lacus]